MASGRHSAAALTTTPYSLPLPSPPIPTPIPPPPTPAPLQPPQLHSRAHGPTAVYEPGRFLLTAIFARCVVYEPGPGFLPAAIFTPFLHLTWEITNVSLIVVWVLLVQKWFNSNNFSFPTATYLQKRSRRQQPAWPSWWWPALIFLSPPCRDICCKLIVVSVVSYWVYHDLSWRF